MLQSQTSELYALLPRNYQVTYLRSGTNWHSQTWKKNKTKNHANKTKQKQIEVKVTDHHSPPNEV